MGWPYHPPAALLAAGTVAQMAVTVMAAQLERSPATERERLLGDVDVV